jgi:hypothetical protein
MEIITENNYYDKADEELEVESYTSTNTKEDLNIPPSKNNGGLGQLENELDNLLKRLKENGIKASTNPKAFIPESLQTRPSVVSNEDKFSGYHQLEKKRIGGWSSNQKRSEAIFQEHQGWLNNFTIKQKELS